MKTTVELLPKPVGPLIPEVGECFRFLDSEVFIRVPDDEGRRAKNMGATEGEFYAVSLNDGRVSHWNPKNLNGSEKFTLLQPKGGEMAFTYNA